MAATVSRVLRPNDVTRPETPLKFRNLRNEPDAKRAELVKFIIGEARKGTKSIGFIPAKGIEEAIWESRVHVLERNDDPVSFAIVGGHGTRSKIFQTWTREDARMLLHGRALVEYLDARACRRGQLSLSLWCLEYLPSVLFWRALGFKEKERRRKSRLHSNEQIRFERPTAIASRALFQFA